MYKKMMEEAKAKGLTSEKMMWESVEDVEEMLCALKMEHPDKYWKFIRKTHGVLFNEHYTEEFAMHDVKHLHYTDKSGSKREGAHWTAEQLEDAVRKYPMPSGVNKWDVFVAGNVAYSDWCKKFDDAQILDLMFLTYFVDEDWGGSNTSPTKIWEYMCCKYNK